MDSVDWSFVGLTGLAVLIEVMVREFGRIFQGEAFDSFLEHSLYVCWEFPDEHLLLDVFEVDVLRFFVEEGNVL